jgi:hypothetical protein
MSFVGRTDGRRYVRELLERYRKLGVQHITARARQT